MSSTSVYGSRSCTLITSCLRVSSGTCGRTGENETCNVCQQRRGYSLQAPQTNYLPGRVGLRVMLPRVPSLSSIDILT